MQTKMLVTALAATAVLVSAAPSHANCAAPAMYGVRVDANTVTVQPQNHQDRKCPDPDGMLRENLQTHEVVRLADFCRPSEYGGPHYVDECVEPGSYRYGFAKPYECAPSACGTYFFATATVTEPLPSQCARSAENAAPTSVASVPWTAEEIICGYAFNEAGYPFDASSGSNLDGNQAGGCSTTSTQTVLIFNAFVVAAGLLGLRQARRS